MFWQKFKELYLYSLSENKGIFGLLLILFALVVIRLSLGFIIKPNVAEHSDQKDSILQFIAGLQPIEKLEYANRMETFLQQRYDTIELFGFDPNTATETQFLALGLTNKQTATILNYRNKGGIFADASDFQKMYGIRQKQFDILEPYIQIAPAYKQTTNNRNHQYHSSSPYYSEKKEMQTDELFHFDPNTIDSIAMQRLGLTPKIINRIYNFRKKGGTFTVKSDFAKMYGIPPDFYNTVKPYISLPDTIIKTPVNINTATYNQLVASNVFTPEQAAKIITKRELFGGLVCFEQLTDLYIIRKNKASEYKPYIIINLAQVKKININLASRDQMRKHPYIGYKLAQNIATLRSYMGKIKTKEDLLTNEMIDNETFEKLKPYIVVE